MNDLHDRLARLTEAGAVDVTPVTAGQADADLDRGRRALRRRRVFRSAGASTFVVAALAAALTYSPVAHPGPDAGTGTTASTVVAAKLVAYQGKQPQGFTIDKVPAGWEIQGGGAGNLTIAPTDAPDRNPDVFEGKIAIMLQSNDDKSTPRGTELKVGGKPAVINPGLGTDHGQNLWVKQPDGVWMLVQIWDARGWSRPDMVEFADGIHVQPGAVRGNG
jgi:hypothetical protein